MILCENIIIKDEDAFEFVNPHPCQEINQTCEVEPGITITYDLIGYNNAPVKIIFIMGLLCYHITLNFLLQYFL